ncbi:MAG: hypothetical protein MJD61_12010 [Proteobacteria bacterium]|nr:hypothetical protein [Pseudomonadota bacterium]
MSPGQRDRIKPLLLIGAGLATAFVAGSLQPPGASSQDRNLAGSAQGSYVFVPTNSNARKQTFDGFITEVTIKLAVDFTERVSAQVKLCYGCHGVEFDMAFMDFWAADEINFRVGRFNPAFGDFPLRHDPANHRTINKPLPYDMGRMLRLREYNMSVMPSPYVDNGVEVNGTHWFGESLQVDYAMYVVSGFKGSRDGSGLDYIQSRSGSFYYVDNNSRPALGGRLALTLDLGSAATVTLGGSAMHGTYDPDNRLGYTLAGADFYARLGKVDLRAEYLRRRTEVRVGTDPFNRFAYLPVKKNGGDFWSSYFLKDGFYAQANMEVTPRLELVARFDGIRRLGNVLATSPLRKDSLVLRYTPAVNVVFDHTLRLKLQGEFYDFSDFKDEIAVSAALVSVF